MQANEHTSKQRTEETNTIKIDRIQQYITNTNSKQQQEENELIIAKFKQDNNNNK